MGPQRLSREAVVHCTHCTVRRNAEHVVLDFGTSSVFTIAVADLRRSAVLAEVERAEGEHAQLSKEHVANWPEYIERGQFHLASEELVSALQVCTGLPCYVRTGLA